MCNVYNVLTLSVHSAGVLFVVMVIVSCVDIVPETVVDDVCTMLTRHS